MAAVASMDHKPVPKRLTEAFDALCVDDENDTSAQISPTGVSELPLQQLSAEADELSAQLSPSVQARLSVYAIIHDINKEATTMAAHDDLSSSGSSSKLVQAVGGEASLLKDPTTSNPLLIDEEAWLLGILPTDLEDAPCPTILEALGEAEYKGCTRPLWKPGRSWWEAKSGRNPWMEPVVHNQRWRYLWPSIHYHKFLSKSLKKLRRCGVNIQEDPSAVCVFLRLEICQVSDHLQHVSQYTAEQWTVLLNDFDGWVQNDTIEQVSALPLCREDDSTLLATVLEKVVGRDDAERHQARKPIGIPRAPASVPRQVQKTPKQAQPQQQSYWYPNYDNSSVHSAISMESYHEYQQQCYYYYYGWVDPYYYPSPEKQEWAHLDQATLQMGLATPVASPPARKQQQHQQQQSPQEFANARPPLLRPQSYPPHPSPATRFLMTPKDRTSPSTVTTEATDGH